MPFKVRAATMEEVVDQLAQVLYNKPIAECYGHKSNLRPLKELSRKTIVVEVSKQAYTTVTFPPGRQQSLQSDLHSMMQHARRAQIAITLKTF